MGGDSEEKGCIVDVVMTHHQLNQLLLRNVFEQIILVNQRQNTMLVSSLALQPLRHHLSRLSSIGFYLLLALYSPDEASHRASVSLDNRQKYFFHKQKQSSKFVFFKFLLFKVLS